MGRRLLDKFSEDEKQLLPSLWQIGEELSRLATDAHRRHGRKLSKAALAKAVWEESHAWLESEECLAFIKASVRPVPLKPISDRMAAKMRTYFKARLRGFNDAGYLNLNNRHPALMLNSDAGGKKAAKAAGLRPS